MSKIINLLNEVITNLKKHALHFFIELLTFTLELIYFKTMPEEFREKAFKPDRLRANLGIDPRLASDNHVGH